MFRKKDYFYFLPRDRIAQMPAESREHSRLMVVDRTSRTIHHTIFSELPNYLEADLFLVVNNTRVLPARLFGDIEGKGVEMLIVRWEDPHHADVMASPAKKFRMGSRVNLNNSVYAVVEGIEGRGKRRLCFSKSRKEISDIGYAPLPPYMKRTFSQAVEKRDIDLQRYQTVYAKQPGSIAAPTAGLHFSPSLLQEIRRVHPVLELTLEVGEATFQSISSEDIRLHQMKKEKVTIPRETVETIRSWKQKGKKLLAVGTTTVRALESYAAFQPVEEEFLTDLFIYSGYRFQMTDQLLTNFHLPESSLFILVSAFAGLELMKQAYNQAVEAGYRFFSYGDAMLIR